MTYLPEFIRAQWRCRAGELLVGLIPAPAIAQRHGTPLFVYDHAKLESRYLALRHALTDRFSISYSIKANPNPALLRFFLGHGCGLEVASAGELQQALAAGCPPQEIVFAGPGKTESELALAIAEGIGEIHAESELEIERIARVCRQQGRRASVALRVNPGEDSLGGAMRMGGKPAPFGVDEEQIEPVLRKILAHQQLDFCGIHLFAGTQILDYKVVLGQYRKGIEIARHVGQVIRSPLRTLDFGGGLGIPYFAGDSALDLDQLQRGLRDLIADDQCLTGTRFMVEPGRFLVGEAGIYIARVNDIKISRSKKFLILDGGMNHHLAASGNLGQVIKRNYPIALLNKMDAPASETVDVVGPLCTPLDTLGRNVQLPPADVGDLVGVFQSGAYARAASPLAFLSHPTPPEILVRGQEDLLIRPRTASEHQLPEEEALTAYADAPS